MLALLPAAVAQESGVFAVVRRYCLQSTTVRMACRIDEHQPPQSGRDRRPGPRDASRHGRFPLGPAVSWLAEEFRQRPWDGRLLICGATLPQPAVFGDPPESAGIGDPRLDRRLDLFG